MRAKEQVQRLYRLTDLMNDVKDSNDGHCWKWDMGHGIRLLTVFCMRDENMYCIMKLSSPCNYAMCFLLLFSWIRLVIYNKR